MVHIIILFEIIPMMYPYHSAAMDDALSESQK